MKKQFTLPEEAVGQRMDVALAGALGMSRAQTQKLIQAGDVTQGGDKLTARRLVQGGEIIDFDQSQSVTTTPAIPELDVLFEDDDVLVVNKPAGLVVHLGETKQPQPT